MLFLLEAALSPPKLKDAISPARAQQTCRRLCSRGEGGREGAYSAATASFQPQMPLREEMDNFLFTQRVTEFRGGRSAAPSPLSSFKDVLPATERGERGTTKFLAATAAAQQQ